MFELKKDYKEYESKTLRLPKELIEKLQVEANQSNISFNKAVIQCIEYSLSNMNSHTHPTE